MRLAPSQFPAPVEEDLAVGHAFAGERAVVSGEGPGRDPRFSLPHYETRLLGLRTTYFDAGEGSPIVFVHGLAANASHFLHVAPEFASRARVIGLDLPGSGNTEMGERPLRVEDLTRHVLALLDHLQIESATIVGHSLGGMIALRAAASQPGRVRSLVLVNPAGLQRFAAPMKYGSRLLHPTWLSPVLRLGWRHVLGRVFHEHNEHVGSFIETILETYDERKDLPVLARVIAELSRDVTHSFLVPHLRATRVPVRMIWGANDRVVPSRVLRKAAQSMSHIIAEEIPRCGHMPIIENPAPVIEMIERALREVEYGPELRSVPTSIR